MFKSHDDKAIKLITLYPNPVTTQLTTVIWSRNDNVKCDVSIFDVYGQKKSILALVLKQGNNVVPVLTANLIFGPYLLNATTLYGTESRLFFKR